MEKLLQDLNAEQRECVQHDASVLQIMAGPGSGKTRVLTVRIALALLWSETQPENIVVVTFTNKAARELKERLNVLIGSTSRKLVVGTFHAISLRYLQRYGEHVGLTRTINVADANDSKNAINRILKALQTEDAADKVSLNASTILSQISKFKMLGITTENSSSSLSAQDSPIFASAEHRLRLVEAYTRYQDYLKAHDLLDFDDLIINAIKLFKTVPNSCTNIQQVFVDEFQDTSAQQFELMRLLTQSNRRLTIVGDHDQSIYGFRAADIQNFHRLRLTYPEGIAVRLQQNYRSTGAIVDAALALIEQDTSRPAKLLRTTNYHGVRPVLRDLRDVKSEAKYIAVEINRLIQSSGSLLQLSDIVVLVRSASQTLCIEQALTSQRIPYKLANARKFLDRRHIRPLIAYLKVIHDASSPALLEIINVPPRQIGKTSIEKLIKEAEERNCSMHQILLKISRGNLSLTTTKNTKLQLCVAALLRTIERCRRMIQEDANISIPEMLDFIIKDIGYESYVKKTYEREATEVFDDIEEFKISANLLANESEPLSPSEVPSNFSNLSSLGRLLSSLALTSGGDADVNGNAVVISTIHNAKGLEWPIVFIPGVYHGSIPSARADQDGEQDEERRLLYVAMTRAKALLYMTWPRQSARLDNVDLSVFLQDSKVARLLQDRGPTFDTIKHAELARFLGRPASNSSSPLSDDYIDAIDLTIESHRKRPLSVIDDINTLPGITSASALIHSMPKKAQTTSKAMPRTITSFFAPIIQKPSIPEEHTTILLSSPDPPVPKKRLGMLRRH